MAENASTVQQQLEARMAGYKSACVQESEAQAKGTLYSRLLKIQEEKLSIADQYIKDHPKDAAGIAEAQQVVEKASQVLKKGELELPSHMESFKASQKARQDQETELKGFIDKNLEGAEKEKALQEMASAKAAAEKETKELAATARKQADAKEKESGKPMDTADKEELVYNNLKKMIEEKVTIKQGHAHGAADSKKAASQVTDLQRGLIAAGALTTINDDGSKVTPYNASNTDTRSEKNPNGVQRNIQGAVQVAEEDLGHNEGQITVAAIKKFQKDHGIAETGIADERTMAAISVYSAPEFKTLNPQQKKEAATNVGKAEDPVKELENLADAKKKEVAGVAPGQDPTKASGTAIAALGDGKITPEEAKIIDAEKQRLAPKGQDVKPTAVTAGQYVMRPQEKPEAGQYVLESSRNTFKPEPQPVLSSNMLNNMMKNALTADTLNAVKSQSAEITPTAPEPKAPIMADLTSASEKQMLG